MQHSAAKTLSVADVAKMQIMSANFADWCVTSVSDPAYDFLFSKASPRRQEYENTLVAIRASLATASSSRAQLEAAVHGVAATSAGTVAAAAPPVNLNPAHCMIPAPSKTDFTGPHQPWVLQGADKQAFEALVGRLSAINPATLGPNTEATATVTKELVDFMIKRKTKTESMVHRLVAGLGGLGVQKRVETFYILSSLFYEHRASAEDESALPYGPIFDRYIPEALRLTLFLSKRGDAEIEYIGSIVRGWETANAFSASVMTSLKSVLANAGRK